MAGDKKNRGHPVRAGHDAISAVKLSQQLTADIDAWAEAHNTVRSDAIRQLVEMGLHASSFRHAQEHRAVGLDAAEIEQLATAKIDEMLDPSLPPDERERRLRRLIEGPPEFTSQRIDLPKHDK